MPNLAPVLTLDPQAVRVRRPNRRPGSCPVPSKVTELHPAPDADTPVVARWLIAHDWSALDAFHVGLGLEVCALMWTIEAASEAEAP